MDKVEAVSATGLDGIMSAWVRSPYAAPGRTQEHAPEEPKPHVHHVQPVPMHESPPLPVVVQRATLDLATHGAISPEVVVQLRTALAAVYAAGS